MSIDRLTDEDSRLGSGGRASATNPSGSPMFFGPTGRELFGWLHVSQPTHADDLGLVICGSLGAEDVAAQRTVRYLATAAAQALVPTLRFDYTGCGHSTGQDDDPGLVSQWVASVHTAIDTLRKETGVGRIALLGLRAGALFAVAAAVQRHDVECLVAVAAPLNGRALLREWKVLAQTMADARRRPRSAADGELEAGGFWFSRETCAMLSEIDLLGMDRPPAVKVLLVEREDVPVSDKWFRHLVAQGAEVEKLALSGYTRMLEEPQRAEVPVESLRKLVHWLCERSGTARRLYGERFEEGRSPHSVGGNSAIVLPSPVSGGSPVVERTVHLSSDGSQLFGMVSSPLTTPSACRDDARKGILLLAHGATRCLGPGRMYVPLARRWAALGRVVLRLDLSGIGDSAAREGQPEHIIYSPSAARDVASALDYMRRELGVEDCQAVGICSGAYHSFKAAVAGHPVTSVIAVNPAVFFWQEGMSLDVLPEDMVTVRSIAGYKRSIRSAHRWRKWLRGDFNLVRAGSMIARRTAMSMKRHLRDVARWGGIEVSNDLAAELRAAAAHKVDLRFIFSPSESGLVLLREQTGSILERLKRDGALGVSMIADADHNFSSRDSRNRLSDMLSAMIEGFPAFTGGTRQSRTRAND